MIEFKNVYKSYKNKPVLKGVTLQIPDNQLVVLIGSSGCGKTTLLKMINRLTACTRGEIAIDGKSIKNMDAIELRRSIGYVVQDGGLFPHLTVAQNIALVLKIMNQPLDIQLQRTKELLEMVGLEPSQFSDRYPSQLSGGQRQRVGVARALSTNPKIILMDEPFSALDPITRAELQDEICHIQRKYKKTIVFVTHDMDEAIKLADQVCIVQEGCIVQYSTPENILKHPANDYVESFIGKNKLWSTPEFIKASDILSMNPFKISKKRSIRQALETMASHRIDTLLVTDENQFEGIVKLSHLNKLKEFSTTIEPYILTDCYTVHEDTPLTEILNAVDFEKMTIIPVLNDGRQVVGYLSKSNLLATLSRQYTENEEVS